MAELNPAITLRIVLRDQQPELMNEYLTNGAQAIPKLIQNRETRRGFSFQIEACIGLSPHSPEH